MELAASRARLSFCLGDIALPVLSLDGEETLSEPFHFRIETLCPEGHPISGMPGQPGQVGLTGRDGAQRKLAGVVTGAEELGRHGDGRRRVLVCFESRLALLRLQSDTRLVLSRSTPEIVRDTLLQHGFSPNQLRFHLTRTCRVRPSTLQAAETDLAFVLRLLAREGIFFWSDQEQGREVVHFADHNSHCPALERPPVRYRPGGGLAAGQPQTAFDRLRVVQQMVPANCLMHNTCELQPGVALEALRAVGAAQSSGPLARVDFAGGFRSAEDAERHAQQRAERARVDSWRLAAGGEVAGLSAGGTLTLDASRLAGDYSGDYLVVSLRHSASQYAGQGVAGEDRPYRCEAQLIRRETPFRPTLPPRPELPLTFSARIEAAGEYAQLDEQGRYRIKLLADREDKPHSEASLPIRRLAPCGGPPGELPVGFHAPLHDGAEVLLSCLNGDPDRPMLVGTLPNPDTPSPVTSANPQQNILRSASGNELCLDDKRQAEAITLQTWGGQNILRMDAEAVGHRLRLATEQGAMQWQANKTMDIRSGGTLTERSGNDRIQTVENRHRTETRSGEIHHQAATDAGLSAAKNLQMRAGRNLEFTAGKHLRLDVEQGQQVTVKRGDASFTVRDGQVHIQAAREIRIEGRGGGDIHFGQSGGGFVIAADGAVKLFGKQVSLKGSGGVSLNGTVNYRVGSPQAMPATSAEKTLVPRVIGELTDGGEPCIFDLNWSRNPVGVGHAVNAEFSVKNFSSGEAATVTVFDISHEEQFEVVDTLTLVLNDGMGRHALVWQRQEEQVQEDLLREEQNGPVGVLSYAFQVEVAGRRSGFSDALNLTTSVTLAPEYVDGNPLEGGEQILLEDAAGGRYVAKVVEGKAHFEGVVIGPWRWNIVGEPFAFAGKKTHE
ncbi:hypothetical protein DESUT3_01780 [Desulfuromonas versatilis]|uniref:Rhs element Vgr protein n=1 Tax=Desulfuromonas versatilis TaxID=2802975 RepID=A0ABN6DV31_9BACT|nr:hypothetical protein DESUT3_01780 [Desulfuromonas versatilis]